jgi:hypothetical protein
MAKPNGKSKYELKFDAFKEARDEARELQGTKTKLDVEQKTMETNIDTSREEQRVRQEAEKTALETDVEAQRQEFATRSARITRDHLGATKRRDALRKELPDLLLAETRHE